MEATQSKYHYTDDMGEISGFGGSYEKACRDMVIAGMEWLDENPQADVSYKEFKNVYGLTTGESEDCKKMQSVMLKASGDDCTGAMMQASMSHIMFAHKNGWEKYQSEMRNKEKE